MRIVLNQLEHEVLRVVKKLGQARALTIQAELGSPDKLAPTMSDIVRAVDSLELLGLIKCWQGDYTGDRGRHHPIKWCEAA